MIRQKARLQKELKGGEKWKALYPRLSREDEAEGDSNSIKNQKAMLEKYAKDHGWKNYKFYIDDGYSGTNFNRPAFEEMMEDVEAGLIDTIVVKDMSRLGRDYLKVGFYTDVVFPEAGVRFIAINDGVDSNSEVDNDFTPFRNIINEWYAKDTSKKIRAVFKAKGMSGKHLSSQPPYGYIKDKDNPDHWVIDERVAPIVQLVFKLFIEGNPMRKIAEKLTSDGIDTPQIHFKKYVNPKRKLVGKYPEIWAFASIRAILTQIAYLGHTVNFKSYKKSYKNKKEVLRPREDWKIFENTHEAIIDKQTFDTVQKMLSVKRQKRKYNEINIFSGILYCADCGQSMNIRRNPNDRSKDIFMCSSYNKKKKDLCTPHSIRVDLLKEMVLGDIRKVTQYVRSHEQKFIETCMQRSQKESAKLRMSNQNDLENALQRNKEIDTIIQRLYEDNIKGKISDERFSLMSTSYENEQAELQKRIVILKEAIGKQSDEADLLSNFIKMVKGYTEIPELTSEILHTLIDKIYIYQSERIKGRIRSQVIKIVYNFVGAISIPNTNEKIEVVWGSNEITASEKKVS